MPMTNTKPTEKGIQVSSKAKCFKLAKEHNLEIEINDGSRFNLSYCVNLPEGFQIHEHDDRTGLCASAESKEELWRGIDGDLLEIISNKPWFAIPKLA